MNIEEIKIADLVTDGLQVRVELDEDTIVKYSVLMFEGLEFKPVVVFRDTARPESAPYLADGFHRVEASLRLGRDTIKAEVHEGDRTAALRHAFEANTTHGLSLNGRDIENMCRIAWEKWDELEPNIDKFSCHFAPALARMCKIDEKTVRKYADILKNGNSRKLPVSPEDEAPSAPQSDATKVTKEHLEERNPQVRKNLKDGLDRYGIAIPDRILEAFRSKEPRKMMRELGKIRNKLERQLLDGNPAFAVIGQDGIIALENAIRRFRFGFAWCVCRVCRGAGCASCCKRGFQTKFQYDRLPKDYQVEKQ